MKIFIIGSYFSEDPRKLEQNIQRARDAGMAILQKGHLPFVPQPMFAYWEQYVDERLIMKTCFDWIAECDAVLVLNVNEDKPDSGTNKALQHAERLDKKVFYSLDEIS